MLRLLGTVRSINNSSNGFFTRTIMSLGSQISGGIQRTFQNMPLLPSNIIYKQTGIKPTNGIYTIYSPNDIKDEVVKFVMENNDPNIYGYIDVPILKYGANFYNTYGCLRYKMTPERVERTFESIIGTKKLIFLHYDTIENINSKYYDEKKFNEDLESFKNHNDNMFISVLFTQNKQYIDIIPNATKITLK